VQRLHIPFERLGPAALLLLVGYSSVVGSDAASAVTSSADPIPVHLAFIRPVGPEQVMLILADALEERGVPINVGRDQGIAIYLGKERTRTLRPMTHDLLVQILKTLDVAIERVTITALREGTYYSEILLRSPAGAYPVDARPSDAIALAVRLDAPMFAAPDLLRTRDGAGRPDVRATAGRRLGLSVQEIDRDLAEFMGAPGVPGVLVASVAPGGMAEGAGLRRGDILKEIDGRPTPDLEAFRAASGQAGEAPRFAVWREGKVLALASP
jgi:bifunctional DNase/RNase